MHFFLGLHAGGGIASVSATSTSYNYVTGTYQTSNNSASEGGFHWGFKIGATGYFNNTIGARSYFSYDYLGMTGGSISNMHAMVDFLFDIIDKDKLVLAHLLGLALGMGGFLLLVVITIWLALFSR